MVVLDPGARPREDRGVPRPASLAIVAALCAVACACSGGSGGSEGPDAVPTSIAAFPDPPKVDGPLPAVLQPALRSVGEGSCAPAPRQGIVCTADGSSGYRVLGQARPVSIDRVRTTSTADHTAWRTEVRLDRADREDAGAARDQAAAFGGVVLVLTPQAPGTVVEVLTPDQIRGSSVRFLGLEKTEAWAVVDAFAEAQTRSAQGM